ncbi:MAG TPA: peroxiredoxin [Actinomycetes bacterium]|nr:peroxiredoxin [Actinomycetes bacterium]
MAILVGALAPDFTLPGWYDGAGGYTLSAERGHPVILVFYPSDEGLVCTRQLCSYSDNLSELRSRDAVVWAISPQSVESHREFAQGRALRMPLLSDPDGGVARAYGILGPMGLRRSVFLVDAEGRIAWRRVTALSLTFPSVAEVRAALEDARAA